MYELLKNTRIIDLTTTYLGPYATQWLGDMGADIIKVEPLEGDVGRSPQPSRSKDMGAGFLNTNRNKRSIAIDLKAPEGREVALKLAASADAFCHNMRADALRRLGLDYETLKAINPAIVYAFSPGFGEGGPYAGRPAYDDIIQALSGLAHLNAGPDGEPRFFPSIVADKVVGLNLALALTAGLAHRFKTGEGCVIEVPMFESMAAFLLVEHLAGRTFLPALGAAGYQRMLARNRRPYRTRDGYVAIMPYTSVQWTRFLTVIGRGDLLKEDWVSDPVQRSQHVEALYQLIADAARERTTAEWISLMAEQEIPCGPVNSLSGLIDDPHLLEAGFFQKWTHPSEGTLLSVRSPLRARGIREAPDRPAPHAGEHSREILEEAGFSHDTIERLILDGVVRIHSP